MANRSKCYTFILMHVVSLNTKQSDIEFEITQQKSLQRNIQ